MRRCSLCREEGHQRNHCSNSPFGGRWVGPYKVRGRVMDDGLPESVDRGTKCFSPQTNGYPGGYPVGFIDWVRSKGWWGDRRLHVPCGRVVDPHPGQVARVDVLAPPITNATDVFDATDSNLWSVLWDESFDLVMIDKPYSEDLAESLYDTKECYAGIDRFVSNAKKTVAPGGYLCTLDYQVPKRPGDDWNLVACWGIYCAMSIRHMMCFQVWQRDGDRRIQGLEKWIR
jgi:hypothetical protein